MFLMNTKINSFMLSIAIALVGTSCGASKNSTNQNYPSYTQTSQKKVTKVKEELNECEQMVIDAPANKLRAYGSAIDEDSDFARQMAIMNAKAQLASDISSLITNIMDSYRGKMAKDGKKTSSSSVRQNITQIAEEIVESTRTVNFCNYALSDGTYERAVCIEMELNTVEETAAALTMTEDDKIGVAFEQKSFKDSLQEALKRYRENKTNGNK